MRTTVNKPQDGLYVLERFIVDPLVKEVQEFTYPTALGPVVQAPSAYHIKCADLFLVEISQVHPAWLYSGLDYEKPYLIGLVTFREDSTQAGITYNLPIPNVKYHGKMTSLRGMLLPSQFTQLWTDEVPINYFGTALEEVTPNNPAHHTILSKVIDETKIKVTMVSPCEFDIEVLEDLTEDQWFYIPVANAKGMPTTIWGAVGYDSDLPEGASAGLIKVRTESLLDAQRGRYTVTGDDLAAVARPSSQVYQRTQVVTYGVGGIQVPPAWYESLFTDTYKETKQYQILEKLVEGNTPYMACGFVTKSSTVGTGLFVRNKNQPCSYPFGLTSLGISHFYAMNQDSANITSSVKVRDLIQVDGWLEQLAKSTEVNTALLEEGLVMPFAASELQFESKATGPYRPLQFLAWNYRYALPEVASVFGVTPTYLPPDATQHCYVPALVCRGSTRVNMLASVYDLDADVSLYIRPHLSWLLAFEGASLNVIPNLILENRELGAVPLDDPIQGYSRDKMGFHGDRSTTSRTLYNYNTVVGYEVTYRGRILWANPDIHPTVGRDYTKVGDKSVCNAIYSAMIMAFTGQFPAGTPAGKYLWKPFSNVQTQIGYLDANNPKYVTSFLTPRCEPETTTIPYMGQNLLTCDTDSIDWLTSADSDGTYTARRVLEHVDTDPNKKTRISASYYMTVDGDTVPLVGYPLANKPTLIDLDDLSGDWACEVDDMAMTAPFWDDDIGQWVVIAVSAQMKKMYRIEVEMDSKATHIIGFSRVSDSRELLDTPYGNWVRILGMTHTKDIHYADGVEDDHIVIYGITQGDPSTIDGGTNLTVATCRTYMEWDLNKDTVTRLKVEDIVGATNFVIDPDVNWPMGIAVMYPYMYVLGFMWNTRPTNPVIDPVSPTVVMKGEGWQMCLWKVDITGGVIHESIPLKTFESYRFSFGIPANATDSRTLYRQDIDSIGYAMKYKFGTTQPNIFPVSAQLPRISTGREYPSVAGIAGISAGLLAFSNYGEQLVLINPMTGYIEELGLNVFPFSYPYNRSVAVERDTISALAKFGGKYFHTTHPFFGLCLGDGVPPNNYGVGIDIQDVTNGQNLLRVVKLKNNLLRDQILEAEITVPEPDVLPNSEMLFLSLDAETPAKSIKIVGPVAPCSTADFFVHLKPEFVDTTVLNDKILLYVNAKFARKTVFFGYHVRLNAPEV